MTYQLSPGTDIGKFITAKKDELTSGTSTLELGEGVYPFTSLYDLKKGSLIIAGKGEKSVINTEPTLHTSGVSLLHFRDLKIEGRLNIDDFVGRCDGFTFSKVRFRSNGTLASTNETVKLTRVSDFTFHGTDWDRTTNANDRLLNIVGGDKIRINKSIFKNGNNGAIQVKGGAKNVIIKDNYINRCGQRAIQIGGSTCFTCWGKDTEPGPYEAEDCLVTNNIVLSNGSGIVISTQKGTVVTHNTFFTVPEGGQYLFRLLQEVEEVSKNHIRPSTEIVFKNNAFFYPVTALDGRGGINGQVANWNNGQDFDTFDFDHNGIYAYTPIVNSQFGARQIYPHRHPSADTIPVKWKKNAVDQVYPDVIDWGLPTMRILNSAWATIGADGKNVGVKGFSLGAPVTRPLSKKWYDLQEQPLYGWEGPGDFDYRSRLETLAIDFMAMADSTE
jgi:parallel beta-helix repeat protein